MSKSVIKRYFSEDLLKNVKTDFKFLIDKIIQSGFEYDLQIRDNHFNLYYKGNSLAKVTTKRSKGHYQVCIHSKFFSGTKAEKNWRFTQKKKGNYVYLNITSSLLNPLFQTKHLNQFSSNIKKVGFQEETTFEQMLMTDNINRSDLIIIDRQIVEVGNSTKMDLLALEQINDKDYRFCVIEVKLGNNPELAGKVAEQLKGYIKRISDNFADYKKCYETNLKQKQELGLINKNLIVNIVEGVSGVVVVGGYSGIAEKHIKELKKKAPDIRILHLKNIIDLSKAI